MQRWTLTRSIAASQQKTIAQTTFQKRIDFLYKATTNLICLGQIHTDTISIFPDGLGFAVGSVEGRVGIQYFNEKSKNFAFRCHRDPPQNNQTMVYPVNNICFNRKYNTFATAGADGVFNFWDKDTKQSLKKFEKCSQTISAAAFQQTNDAHTMPLYVYAISYDFHKGPEYLKQGERHTLWLHASKDEEIRPKPGGRR